MSGRERKIATRKIDETRGGLAENRLLPEFEIGESVTSSVINLEVRIIVIDRSRAIVNNPRPPARRIVSDEPKG